MAILEEQISDTLGFKLYTSELGIAVFPDAPNLDLLRDKDLSLLAVGNLTGTVALSNIKTIKIGKTSLLVADTDSQLELQTIECSDVRQLQFNANEKSLWVVENNSLAYVSLNNGLSNLLLEATRFTEIDSILAHPTDTLKLAFVTNDKVLHVLPNVEVGNSIEVLQNAQCFAWSLDGKALAAMSDTNEIHLYTVDGEKTASIPVDVTVASELDLETDSLLPCSIKPLSNDTWLVIHDKNDALPDDHEIASFIVTRSETRVAEILLPGFDTQRSTTYYAQGLPSWSRKFPKLTLVTSSLATEVVVLNNSTQALFVTPDEDIYRTTFPMNEVTEEDTNAIGFALDLTATGRTVLQPWTGVDEAVGVLPIVWVLLDTGRLTGWYLVDKEGIKDSLLSLSRALKCLEADVASAEEVEPEVSAPVVKSTNDNPFATSSAAENPFEPSKDSPFGTVSTKDNPFASGFGQTSVGNKQDDPKEGFGSGFGQSGFDNAKKLENTPSKNEFGAKSDSSSSGFVSGGFGSSAFGSSGFGSSGFGSSGFGESTTSSAFGKTGFGALKTTAESSSKTTTFGQPGLVGSAFGQTSFASAGNTNKLGSQLTVTTHSGFAKFGGSGFASSSNESPFAKLGSSSTISPKKDSPFANLADSTQKDSPFASLGDSAKKDSPFASLGDSAKKDSPFASLGDSSKKDSPFASLGDSAKKDSPFASLGDSAKKDSPFASLGDSAKKDSPFASLGDSSKKDSPFTSFGDSAKEGSQFTSFGGSAKKDSPFESLTTTKNAIPDERGSSIKSFASDKPSISGSEKPTPFAEEIESTPEPLKKEEVNDLASFMTMDSLGNETDSLKEQTNIQKLGSLNLTGNKPSNTKNQFVVSNPSQNLSSFSVSLVKSGDFNNIQPKMRFGLVSREVEKQEGFIESLDESEVSNETSEELESHSTVDSDQESFNDLGESLVEIDEDSDGSLVEVGIPSTTEFEELHFHKPKEAVKYCRYDGATKEMSKSKNEIYDKMVEVYNHTEGELTILNKNTKSFEKFVKSHDKSDYRNSLSKKPECWRIAWSSLLPEMLSSLTLGATELLPILESQLKESEMLVDSAKQLRIGIEDIQKMILYISKLQDDNSTTVLKKMELDLGTRKLQTSLRKKLSDVEQKQEKLLALMMPLKVQYAEPYTMISNLKKTLLRLQERVIRCEENYMELSITTPQASSGQKLLTNEEPATSANLVSQKAQWAYSLTQTGQTLAVFE